jgi:hypothetical protein
MRNRVKFFAVMVMVLALTAGQTVLMAAPTQGARMATEHSANPNMFSHFLSLLGAIWGGGGGAIWGGGGGGGAIWGGGGGGGAIWGGGGGGGAIWGGGGG